MSEDSRAQQRRREERAEHKQQQQQQRATPSHTCAVGERALYCSCSCIALRHANARVCSVFALCVCSLCVCVWCAVVSDGAGMQAGTIMASCLVLGIVLGSTFSFAVKFAYTGTDPFCAS